MIAVMTVLFSTAGHSEKTYTLTLDNEGQITCEKGGNFSTLIVYEPRKKMSGTTEFQYELQINSDSSKIEQKSDRDYVVMFYDSSKSAVYLKPGENELKGSAKADIDVFAWDEPGSDMNNYITGCIAAYNLYRPAGNDEYDKTVSKIQTVKDILYARIEFLRDNIENSGLNLEKLKNILEKTEEELNTLKKEKEETETTIEADKKEIQELNSQIAAKEEQLKNEPDNILLQLEIKELKSKQEETVVKVQNMNIRVYEIDKLVPKMEEIISGLEEDINSWPDIIENYTRETVTRQEELNRLNELDLSASDDSSAYVTYHETSVTVIKKDDGYSFGEVFGISCISSAGIALPAAMIYSSAYTEFRLPGKSGPEDRSDSPASKENSNLVGED